MTGVCGHPEAYFLHVEGCRKLTNEADGSYGRPEMRMMRCSAVSAT